MRFFSTLIASILGTLLAFGLAFFFGFLFLVAIAASSSQVPAVRSGSVLVMNLSGSIPERVSHDPFNQMFANEPAYDLYDVKEALEKAAQDDRIDGIWLQLRGLSASWGTLEEIRGALLRFKESGKPIMASSGEYMIAEKGYFLASVADSVFASPQGFFEFNGFYLNVTFLSEMLSKLDVEPQIVRAGKFKGAVEPYLRSDLSEENRTQLAALVEAQDRVFMHALAESRNMSLDELNRLSTEDAFITAQEGKEAGLLDGLLFDDEVEALLNQRLGYDEDAKLRTVSMKSYVNVPASEAGIERGNEGEIAVVYAVGTILSGSANSNGIVGSRAFNKAMREARTSSRVKAVVLRINSPGGSASASDAMRREIELTQKEKPVIVSMGDVAASGGYWLATASDTIVADPLTITGSIGVFTLFFDVGGLMENKLGITTDGVSTSPYADMLSGMRPFSDGERALLQRSTDTTYRAFLNKVAASRNLSVEEVDAIAQGRVWIGQDAQKIGLVDVLGGLDTAIDIAAEKADLEEGSYRVRLLPKPKTFIEELNETMYAKASNAWINWRGTTTEKAFFKQVRQLDRLIEMQGTVQALMPMEMDIR